MLKSLLEEKGISIYKLSKESQIPYSTLNDLVNHRLPIENMRCGQVHALCDVLHMDMDSLYKMCSFVPRVFSDKYGIPADIQVKHKTFQLSFQRNGKIYESEIAPVHKVSFQYLDTLAEWKLNEMIGKITMEEIYESILAKTV